MLNGGNVTMFLVSLYNPNIETEQVVTLPNLGKLLETIKNFHDKYLVFAASFNFFFDTSVDSYGSKPAVKKKFTAKFIEIKEKFDLCENWRIRSPRTKR